MTARDAWTYSEFMQEMRYHAPGPIPPLLQKEFFNLVQECAPIEGSGPRYDPYVLQRLWNKARREFKPTADVGSH